MTKYAYYPGCSSECNAAAYELSTQAVAKAVGLQLAEIDDWNCCGATEYFSQDELTACSVIARNLALVDDELDQVVTPCAACYLNLAKVDDLMATDPKMSGLINQALAAGSLQYEGGRLRVRHILDVICDDMGEEKIRSLVKKPLSGLKVASYYGCQVVRPYKKGDCTEYPMKMDHLFEWLGAEIVEWGAKAHCCGGHMTQLSDPDAFELIRRLLKNADDNGADVIATMCPMCQLNLDAYQSRVNGMFKTNFNLPVIYFTQLIGLAFGLDPKSLGFGKELVAAMPILEDRITA